MKYGYITLFAMASVVACAVPTSSSEQDNSVQSASASCGAAYAQCGGQGFTGPTCCVSGNTCTYSNQWYSQCVPGGGGGSSSGGSSSSSGGSKGGGTGCTAGSSQDALQRAAATTALNLMRLVAPSAPTGWTQDYPLNQTQAFSILASQRYRVLSSGTGIEFDPNDSVYSYVTNAMQAELAFAQMDSNVAKFLSDGLKNAHSTTDGQVFPSIRAIAGLANYTDSGPTTVHIADPTTSDGQHHTVTVTTLPSPKCGEPTINFAEQVETSWQFSPLFAENYSDFNRNGQTPAILGFTGSSHRPATPFNGPSGNPHLVVSVNGSSVDWASYDFTAKDCSKVPSCSGTLQMDPTAYLVPDDVYDTTGAIMGTQANPFQIIQYQLVADPYHLNNWGTQVVNGVQEWGTFTQPVMRSGVIKYMYVKQY